MILTHTLALAAASFAGQAPAVTCPETGAHAAEPTVLAASYAPKADIVDTAIDAGSFNTLAAALEAAGLVGALKGDGPFTVFAPTDEAFKKLPAGTVETLLKPENKDKLIAVLTYHVVPASMNSRRVTQTDGAVTLNGQRLGFSREGGNVLVDSARVTSADIECSNGVIHVIDQVVLPEEKNIVEVAERAGSFSTLLAAAKAAGLADALAGDGPLTVFAPTDAAFAKLPAGTVDELLKPENKDKLASILKFHVVPGRVYADQAISARRATTLLGRDVRISTHYGTNRIQNARIVETDIDASNGVIHIIDEVILPE